MIISIEAHDRICQDLHQQIRSLIVKNERLKAAAQQALEAMLNFPDDISDEMFESITALKAALAEPVQEPVGVVTSMVKGGVTWHRWSSDMPDGTKLYAAPANILGPNPDSSQDTGHAP